MLQLFGYFYGSNIALMKNIWFLLIALAFIFCQACAPVYIPTNSNVPLFTEKGEIQLAAYQGSNGMNVQAAVSVIDHVAVMGNFGFRAYENEDSHKNNKQKFGEFGIGYYDTFGSSGRYEFYGGYGKGESSAYNFFHNNDDIRIEAKFDRWFLQGNIGLGNKIVEGAISYRLSYVNFYRIKEIGLIDDVFHDPMEELMMEPAFTIKVGGERIKFISQFGFSFPYDNYVKFDYQPFYMSVGIQGKIPAW